MSINVLFAASKVRSDVDFTVSDVISPSSNKTRSSRFLMEGRPPPSAPEEGSWRADSGADGLDIRGEGSANVTCRLEVREGRRALREGVVRDVCGDTGSGTRGAAWLVPTGEDAAVADGSGEGARAPPPSEESERL